MARAQSLTLAVVFRNEESNLPSLLHSFDQNIFDPEIHFLFIDNDSQDQSRKIVEDWLKKKQRPGDRLIVRGQNHLAEARQQALDEAQTSHLVFIDADSLLCENWQEGVLRALAAMDEDTAIVGGESTYVIAKDWHFWAQRIDKKFPLGRRGGQQVTLSHVPTNNWLGDIAKVQSCGGFNYQFGQVGEDLELSRRVQKNYKIKFHPVFRLDHRLPEEEWLWYRKMAFYGAAQGLVFGSYGEGVPLAKAFPALFFIGSLSLLIAFPWMGTLGLLLLLIIRPLRFFALSFLFYGLGEWLGVSKALGSKLSFRGLLSRAPFPRMSLQSRNK